MPLLARVLDVVVLRQRLVRTRKRVLATPVIPAEPPPVERPDVPLGTAVDDPLAHDLPDAAGPGEPVCAASSGEPEARDIGLAEEEVGVGRERFRPVEERLDLGVLHRRHAVDCVREQLLHPLPLLGEELRLEAVGDAVDRPRRRLPLVAAHHEAADLGAEVDEIVGIAQGRERLERRIERLGDEVLVAERDHRHVDADERRDLTRVHAGSVDHDFALDPPLVGLDRRDAAVARLDSRYLRAHLDPRPEAAGAVRQRERQL